MPEHTHNPIRVYEVPSIYDRPEATKVGPRRSHGEKCDQSRAIRTLTADWDSAVYAVRFPDGTIKIGCSADMAARHRHFRSSHGEIVGFMPGDFEDERAIHEALAPHRARAREYYHPTAAVLAVVNDMRDQFNLPHIAA